MYHFCTLFDRNYLFKGVALYNSLSKTCQEFTLYILCMDELTRDVLTELKLTNARLISIAEFEDEALKAIKPTRSRVEYYWTCTPSLLLYVLAADRKIDLITYLDADLLFFSDPQPIFSEFGDDSIMIIEHRFPENLKYLEVNGIYNVQMLNFRRDANSLECLKWYRDRCLEWCYYRVENNKLGDQKYLDDWPVRFDGVHVLQHIGAGVAPWNVSEYEVIERDGEIWINDQPLIFYHFHQFTILPRNKYFLASDVYCCSGVLSSAIYERYIEYIEESMTMVHKVVPGFGFGISKRGRVQLRDIARRYLPGAVKTVLRKMKW